jgi:hypothetical protein
MSTLRWTIIVSSMERLIILKLIIITIIESTISSIKISI